MFDTVQAHTHNASNDLLGTAQAFANAFNRPAAAARHVAAPDRGPNVDAPTPDAQRYVGPERRTGTQATQPAHWLALMLDEIDYGMLLLVDGSQVLHVNHCARAELDTGHPLQMLGNELRARQSRDVVKLHDALTGAQRGLRKLVTLGEPGHQVSLAVVPLGAVGVAKLPAALLLLGKRQVCERLSVQCFARSHELTPTETRVLEALCQGLDPREVANHHAVAIATIRSQISAIRAKIGAENIRDLVRQVAVLPPMVGVLRMAA